MGLQQENLLVLQTLAALPAGQLPAIFVRRFGRGSEIPVDENPIVPAADHIALCGCDQLDQGDTGREIFPLGDEASKPIRRLDQHVISVVRKCLIDPIETARSAW